VRRFAREQHRRYVFRRAMRRLSQQLQSAEFAQPVLSDLVYGWANSWSVKPEYIAAFLRGAREAEGPILECGSGLSTVLLGSVAQRTGNRVWSLEHDRAWAKRTRDALRRFGITSVELCVSDLRDYGSYTWYNPPAARMPTDFALVVCDGPPGQTPGGRYGLLPILGSHLKPGCTILLDDAARPMEREALARWAHELGVDFTIGGVDKPFAMFVVPYVSNKGDQR
jgi:predicted O-methyltransferase YrrM